MIFMIFIWWKLKMSYHTVYPSWDGPSVVCYLFLHLFICAPTIAFTWLPTFCTLHLSSTFYLSQDTKRVQGFIFEGDLQFSKLFKMTICEGMCTLKCTEKRLITFPPPFISLSPIQNLKEALNFHLECTVLYHTSFRNYASISLQVPSNISILLDKE